MNNIEIAEELLEEYNKYLDQDGKITAYPSKKHKRIREYLYRYLITRFQDDIEYSEKQVNQIINDWILFGDFCLVRREMIELQLLSREKDGSKYWVTK